MTFQMAADDVWTETVSLRLASLFASTVAVLKVLHVKLLALKMMLIISCSPSFLRISCTLYDFNSNVLISPFAGETFVSECWASMFNTIHYYDRNIC